MVTTNIQEIRELFGQALLKVDELVKEIGTAEADLRNAAHTLFVEAVRVAMPTLEYVDERITLGEQTLRGVRLDDSTVLTRKGVIVGARFPNQGVHYESFYAGGDTDIVVDQAVKRLENLGNVFNRALSKMDERRECLADRRKKLQEAIKPFQRSASQL